MPNYGKPKKSNRISIKENELMIKNERGIRTNSDIYL